MEYIERLLQEDIRNNSAWNQRFFVVSHQCAKGVIDGDALDREVSFVRAAIEKDPANESSWNYFRGVLDNCPPAKATELRPSWISFCRNLHSSATPSASNVRHSMAAEVDLLSDDLEEWEGVEGKQTERSSHLEKAMEVAK